MGGRLLTGGALIVLAWVLSVSGLANAARSAEKPELPNFDARIDRPQAPLSSGVHAERWAKLRSAVPGVTVDFDSRLDSPTWVAAPGRFLTGPNGVGAAVAAQTLAGFSATDSNRVTKAFLQEHASLFGHGPEVLGPARIKRDFVGPNNGLRTVVWEQQLDGIAVFEGLLISHVTKKGELVSVSSHFLPALETAAATGTPGRARLQANPEVSPGQAAVLAMQNLGENMTATELSATGAASGLEKQQTFVSQKLLGTTEARLVWLPLERGSLCLCWEVILMSRARGEMYRILVDARSGAVWLRQCLTENLTNATYRVFSTYSPTPLWPGYATPNTNQPSQVSRVLVVTNAFNVVASPNGWIDDTNNETLGNNVDAHLDRNADNLPDLPRPRGSPFRVFDFALDLTQDPSTYGDASVVNSFYWANWMHDKLYEFGFNEAAGNFQADNFGRGGASNDPVQLDGQDGGGYNNANFSTPPDGQPGRMQLFIWNGPVPNRDGGFDTEIILHEYAHGLSNRRVGGGVGISALQSRGLGEGWSDFYSLALLSQAGDSLGANYPEGPYAAFQYSGLTENYYYGIRRYPYSTNLSCNPETFIDIEQGVTHHTGIPRNPAIADIPNEIHNQGEVWCVTLWDTRANLINKYGFATGNQLILQLVTDAMNLTPANPTFLQARDAIIQADLVDNAGVNYHELWLAFAKRGMGYKAVAPPNSTTTGVVESYDVPDNLFITPAGDFVAGGSTGGPFAPSNKVYGLHNTSTSNLNWTAGASVPWVSVSPSNGLLAANGGATNVQVSLNLSANGLDVGNYNGQLVFTNLANGITQTQQVSLSVFMLPIYTFPLNSDPGWARTGEWAFGQPLGLGGTAHGYPDPTAGATGANVFGVNLAGDYSTAVGGPYYLTAGPLDFSQVANVALQFQRWLNFDKQQYAFATIDASTNGVNWTNISQNGLSEIADASWQKLQYDLSTIADHRPTVYVRWGYRIAAGAFAYSGWNIDDVEFLGMSQLVVTLPASATEGAGLLAGQGRVSVAHAPQNNLIVSLTSSNTARVTVPATVTILAGQTNAAFDLIVLDDLILNGTVPVNIGATAPGHTAGFGTIPIFDNETAILGISLPANATEGDAPIQGTVTISAAPGVDASVSLISSDPASLSVPAAVVVPSGQTSAVFFATVVDDHKINGDRLLTVTAHVANWTDGVTSITIHDNENTNLTLILPGQTRESNGVLTNSAEVCISGTLTTNFTVSLASSNLAKLTVPATATILAGQTCAVFNLTMIPGSLPHSPQWVPIAANAPGFAAASGTVNVIDNETPPAPVNPRPADNSSTNPVTVDLSWCPGPGEGLQRLVNGGFESGTFTNWVATGDSNGGFVIDDGTVAPPSFDVLTAPFHGNFSALADGTAPAISTLYQEVALPLSASTITLSWVDRIRNFNANFDTNQQFRVEVRNTNNAVLAVVFATAPGDSLMNNWVQRSANLTGFKGQTVRVAFVVEAGQYFLDVHVDEVAVWSSTLPVPTYDVYFGTNAVPGAPEYLGSTTNTFWTLPDLAPYVPYYWQVVARRANETAGPVWAFSTLPALSITNMYIVEGDASVTTAVFNVSLSPTNDQFVAVDFTTVDDTATSPTDYAATNGTLIFFPGDTNQTIVVAVNGNTNVQPNRAFHIVLSNAINAALTTNFVTGTIVDDDSPPLIQKISVSGGQATLWWSSIPGRTYRVQYKTNLTDLWIDLPGDVPAVSPTASKVDTSGLVSKRYYRVRVP